MYIVTLCKKGFRYGEKRNVQQMRKGGRGTFKIPSGGVFAV
jgi:hypothetical protein